MRFIKLEMVNIESGRDQIHILEIESAGPQKFQNFEYRKILDSTGPQLKAITVLRLNSYEF